MKSLGKASICDVRTGRGIISWTWDTFNMFVRISQRCFDIQSSIEAILGFFSGLEANIVQE
jgi:hypothetical protein